MTRKDYLKECNDQGVALSDFDMTFCKQCYQPECTRSRFGTMKFDERVQNWKERLFTDVPRMDPSDPKFSEFQAKLFKMVNPEALSKPGEWVDAREYKSSSVTVPAVAVTPPAVAPAEPKPPSPEPQPTPTSIPREVVLVNTPVPKELTLPGKAAPTPRKDAWAAPSPPGEKVVKTGTTVRFGVPDKEGEGQ